MQPGTDGAARIADAEHIEISPEMTVLLDCDPADGAVSPVDAVALVFSFGEGGAPAALRLEAAPNLSAHETGRLVFLVARAAVERLGGLSLLQSNSRDFYLASELRAIAMALRDPPVGEEARTTYRAAKSIELLCETIRLFRAQRMTPLSCDGALSAADTRRILAARKLIDERWSEKLTLDEIARACGLNRAKLTRGFREVFECSVAEAMAERRLSQASQLLLTTDLPVSSVGYESGYLNNASFARAFGRHFGRSPSDYRASGIAA